MKNKKLINWLLIIFSITFIIGYMLIGLFYQKKVIDRSYNRIDGQYNYCLENEPDDEYCAYIIKNYGNKEKLTPDAISLYMENAISPKIHMLNFLLPILVVLPALYNLCHLFSSKEILNMINETDYKKLLKKLFLKSYKYALVLPISVGIVFLVSFLITGHLDYSYAINRGMYELFWFDMNGIVFILLYLLSLFLFSTFYINLGLIVLRRKHNIIITILETFILFIGLEYVLEFCGIIPSFFGFDNHSDPVFSIINVLSSGFATNSYEMILYPLMLVISTFIIVLFLYKDKEKFIIDCEKNNLK